MLARKRTESCGRCVILCLVRKAEDADLVKVVVMVMDILGQIAPKTIPCGACRN